MSSYQASVNYYSVLGVSSGASVKEINLAFKKLALKLHPDKSGGDRASIEQFHLTQEAVETLRDPERRRRHDESLSRHSFNINRKHNGQARYNGACGSLSKFEKNEWNNEGDWNPPKSQHTSRGTANGCSSSECARESDELPSKQHQKSLRDMWGPFIHAYTVHPPRPILKVPMPTHPPQPTGEGESEFGVQSTANEPEMQQTSTEPQPDKTQMPTMQDQQAEETVKEEGTEGADTRSDEPVDIDANSIFHDSTDYESLGDSYLDEHPSSHLSSWAAHGYDSSSEDGGVTLPSEFGEDQKGEDDTVNTMYYDCSEHHEHYPAEDSTSSMDEESTGDEAETNTNDETDENTDARTEGHQKDSNIWPTLRPFVPYFDGKLQSSQGRYTVDDMVGEMRGLFLEPYRGWLETIRPLISGATKSYNSRNPEECEHRGLWIKAYGHSVCPHCDLYEPLYLLTCPGCGEQACIRCKFDYPSTGAEMKEGDEMAGAKMKEASEEAH